MVTPVAKDPMIAINTFLIVFFSMLVRSLTGFGSALIAIPLLSILFGTKYAIPFIVIYECLIDLMILAADRSRLKADLSREWPLLAAGLIGVPIGTHILIISSDRLLKVSMGAFLIIFSILLLRNMSLNIGRDRFGSVIAGLIGGFLCGSVGLPGPPIALLLSSQGFEKGEFRRLIVVFLTAVDFFTFGYYTWVGLITADMLLQSIKFLPALILGFLAGSFTFRAVNEAQFKRLTLFITMAAGAVLLWSTVG